MAKVKGEHTSGQLETNRDALRKTNIAPENMPFQKETSSSKHNFSRDMGIC